MHRCLELAKLAAGAAAPNPMVGALLVYDNTIIGEGYHQNYGGPHAEVNCIRAVKECNVHLIEDAVLYVSLEPCAHFGKTPPCSDLIIESKIKKVVIGCRDPFVEVNGKGIDKLQAAGIEVVNGILEDQCVNLNKRFFTFHTKHRPYIILKWAQTQNGKIAAALNPVLKTSYENTFNDRLFISNDYTNRLVHKWRREEASILIGTNTAIMDDPELTNRYWPGSSPVRLVVDMMLTLPSNLKMFNDNKSYTVIFNSKKHELKSDLLASRAGGVGFYQITNDVSLVHQVMNALYQSKVQSVLVEGGAKLLQSFIDEDQWDEARVITNSQLEIAEGLGAPSLSNHHLIAEDLIMSDQIHYFANQYSHEVHSTS